MAKWWWLGGSGARGERGGCVSPMPSHCTAIPKFGVGIGCAPKSSPYQATDAARSGAWTLTWLTRMAVMARRPYRAGSAPRSATAGCETRTTMSGRGPLASEKAAQTVRRRTGAPSGAAQPPSGSHRHCKTSQPHRRPFPCARGADRAKICTNARPRRGFRLTMSSHLHAVSADHGRLAAPSPDVVTAPLLDLVPEFADGLTPALAEQVRAWLVVRVWSLPRGSWPAATHTEHGLMGLLVVDGVLARCMGFGKAAYPELVGHGDLVRPWDAEPAGHLGRLDVSWQVLEPCRVAVLDRRFAGIVGRWPEIVDQLLSRAMSRASALDFSMAIAQLPLLDARLLAMLWHLADRWGVQLDDGVYVPIRLTHSLLASLVLARRPSVSTALAELDRRGLVSRSGDGWLLRGAPPTELHRLSRRDGHGALGG